MSGERQDRGVPGLTRMCSQGVFDVDFSHGLTLIEIADGVTVDEIKEKTEAPFNVAADLKPML